MKQENRPGKLFSMTLAALLVLGAAAPLAAHWRPSRHRHRSRRATIVVGSPSPVKRVVLVAGRPAASIDFNVDPEQTRIFVNGSYRGTCDEFDGFPQKMYLRPGTYTIRLVTPDGTAIQRKVTLVAGHETNLNLQL